MTAKSDDGEINLNRQVDALRAIDARRRRLGMSVYDMEAASGVSVSSFYAYFSKNGRRNPSVSNIIALAEAVGFEVVMRRKPSVRSSHQGKT